MDKEREFFCLMGFNEIVILGGKRSFFFFWFSCLVVEAISSGDNGYLNLNF